MWFVGMVVWWWNISAGEGSSSLLPSIVFRSLACIRSRGFSHVTLVLPESGCMQADATGILRCAFYVVQFLIGRIAISFVNT
jgi:hypothetical protein